MDTEITKTRDEIIGLCEEEKKLKEKIKGLVAELQSKCGHESVIETPYEPENLVSYFDPSRRICAICALEEGSECGFKILTAEPIKIVPRCSFWGYRKLQPLIMVPIPANLQRSD